MALMTDNPRSTDEFETVEFRPADTDREAVELELHHSHLPHLDEAEFIDWNRNTNSITKGENFEEVRPLLELIDEHREELPDDWL